MSDLFDIKIIPEVYSNHRGVKLTVIQTIAGKEQLPVYEYLDAGDTLTIKIPTPDIIWNP